MSLYIGNDKIGSLYLGSTKIKEAWVGDVKVYGSGDPYNPLNLPPFTIRVRLAEGAPTSWWYTFDSYELVDEENNIWDFHKNSTDWSRAFDINSRYREYLLEVLGANTTGVTSFYSTFYYCWSLTSMPLFDTRSATDVSCMFQGTSITDIPQYDFSSVVNMNGLLEGTKIHSVPMINIPSGVTSLDSLFYSCSELTDTSNLARYNTNNITSMQQMFWGCRSLVNITLFDTSNVANMYNMFSNCNSLEYAPAIDTSSVTTMESMFWYCRSLKECPNYDTSSIENVHYIFHGCRAVESGALSFYNNVKDKETLPILHAGAFDDCGIDTQTGLAELQQIPQSWGGLAPG
jgi:surface protein